MVDGLALGRVPLRVTPLLADFPDVFIVSEESVSLAPDLTTPMLRTEAVGKVLEALHADGHIPGWRDEHYPVSTSFYVEPHLTIERAAVPLFGTLGYGVHLNGFVADGEQMMMWVGKRSMNKPTGPGKLDQVVAGGQPIGISVWDNLMKECHEEAGMPKEMAERAISVGEVSYLTERPEGLRHDVLLNYDIELPLDFEPVPTDGEVDAFYLWPIEEVMQRIRETDDFKFNAALVIIDFAVRHGIVGPDDPDYITICEALRIGRNASIKAR